MFNQIFVGLAVLSIVVLFAYLALWSWKDMKQHEQKGKGRQYDNRYDD